MIASNLAGNTSLFIQATTANISENGIQHIVFCLLISPAPSPPVNCSLLVATSTSLLVSWSGSTGNIEGYEVEVQILPSTEIYAAYNGPDSYFQLAPIAPSTTVGFRIRAFNSEDGLGEPSAWFYFATLGRLSLPTFLLTVYSFRRCWSNRRSHESHCGSTR